MKYDISPFASEIQEKLYVSIYNLSTRKNKVREPEKSAVSFLNIGTSNRDKARSSEVLWPADIS